MHLRGGHVRRRVLADEERIERVALWQLPDTTRDRRARCVRLERGDDAVIGRPQVAHECRLRARDQRFLACRSHRARGDLPAEVVEHRALPGGARLVPGRDAVANAPRLTDQDRIHRSRQEHAALRLEFEPFDETAQVRRRGRHPAQPGLCVLDALDPLGCEHLGDIDRRADDLVEREDVIPPPVTLEQQFLRAFEHAVLESRLRSERRRREFPPYPGQLLGRRCGLGPRAALADRLPAIGSFAQSLVRRKRGVRRQQSQVGALEVFEQARICRGLALESSSVNDGRRE